MSKFYKKVQFCIVHKGSLCLQPALYRIYEHLLGDPVKMMWIQFLTKISQ